MLGPRWSIRPRNPIRAMDDGKTLILLEHVCYKRPLQKERGAKRTRRTRPGMHIGYARVSTDDQQLHLQLDALTPAGCTQIFHDEGISGAQVQRPGLDAALAALTPGDVLVVWRLDRL